MSATLLQFIALLVVHWIADFVLQTHWQASNKSKDNEALLRHVGTYTVVLMFVVPFIFPGELYRQWLIFVVANAVLHFATDYITSRASSKLFGKDWHNFFVIVGFDQLLHQMTLAVTMALIFGDAP